MRQREAPRSALPLKKSQIREAAQKAAARSFAAQRGLHEHSAFWAAGRIRLFFRGRRGARCSQSGTICATMLELAVSNLARRAAHGKACEVPRADCPAPRESLWRRHGPENHVPSACALRRALDENADEPKAYHMHTRERIYPAIACFDAMIAEGVDRAEAADFLTDYYVWRAGGMARLVKAVFKVLGLYRAVPRVFYGMTKKSFGPQAGFVFEGACQSRDEVRVDMVRCPYMDACARYVCSEDRAGLLRRRRRVLRRDAPQDCVGAHQDAGIRTRPLRLQGPRQERLVLPGAAVPSRDRRSRRRPRRRRTTHNDSRCA